MEKSNLIEKNKVDQDDNQPDPLKQFQLKIIREQLTQEEKDQINEQLKKDPKSYVPKYDEEMPREDMLKLINEKLKALPDRKDPKNDVDILKYFEFQVEADADNNNDPDPFKKQIPDQVIKFQDLTENHKDFDPTQQHQQDLNFKDKIEKIKDWEIKDYGYKNKTKKNDHVSQFLEVKE